MLMLALFLGFIALNVAVIAAAGRAQYGGFAAWWRS